MCTSGPSFKNRQSETVAALIEVAAVVPDVLHQSADIVTANINAPGMADVSERLRKQRFDAGIIPPTQWTEAEKQQVAQAQAQQQEPPADPLMVAAQAEQQKAQADLIEAETKQFTAQSDVQAASDERQIAAFEAETKRFDVEVKAKTADANIQFTDSKIQFQDIKTAEALQDLQSKPLKEALDMAGRLTQQ